MNVVSILYPTDPTNKSCIDPVSSCDNNVYAYQVKGYFCGIQHIDYITAGCAKRYKLFIALMMSQVYKYC